MVPVDGPAVQTSIAPSPSNRWRAPLCAGAGTRGPDAGHGGAVRLHGPRSLAPAAQPGGGEHPPHRANPRRAEFCWVIGGCRMGRGRGPSPGPGTKPSRARFPSSRSPRRSCRWSRPGSSGGRRRPTSAPRPARWSRPCWTSPDLSTRCARCALGAPPPRAARRGWGCRAWGCQSRRCRGWSCRGPVAPGRNPAGVRAAGFGPSSPGPCQPLARLREIGAWRRLPRGCGEDPRSRGEERCRATRRTQAWAVPCWTTKQFLALFCCLSRRAPQRFSRLSAQSVPGRRWPKKCGRSAGRGA